MNQKEITAARIRDLAGRAFERNYTVYSDFLNMEEQSILHSLRLPVGFTLYGGYEDAERMIAAFGASEPADFPIVCLCIEPLNKKFADRLTHRDYLGALMNLGISRAVLGDIAVQDSTAYLFCLTSIADYIAGHLTRVRHTSVSCVRTELLPAFLLQKPPESMLTAPSLRADAVVAAVYKLSRSSAASLFSSEKVYVNARLITKESAVLKAGDIVSVRGHGRFIYEGTVKETKKQRLLITVRIYQ